MSELFEDIEFLRETFEGIEPTTAQQDKWSAAMHQSAHQLLTDATASNHDPLPLRLLLAAAVAAVISVGTLFLSPLDSSRLKGRIASVSTSIHDVNPLELVTSGDTDVTSAAKDTLANELNLQTIIDDVKSAIPAASLNLRDELLQLTTTFTQPFVRESMREKTNL